MTRVANEILHGQPPYGWKFTKDRSKLVRNAGEQRVIAVMRHMYFIRRLPMREVVAELALMGVVNRRGKAFQLSRVCEILRDARRPARQSRS